MGKSGSKSWYINIKPMGKLTKPLATLCILSVKFDSIHYSFGFDPKTLDIRKLSKHKY